jgi:hypothetical protein
MKKALIVEIITYFFILLFLYTGAAKLMEIHLFKEQLVSSPLMGSLAGFITWALPIGELLLAIALFIPAFRLKALYVTLVLMTLFTGYVVAIFLIDNHLSCSCGGIIEKLSPKRHILFNSACVVLSEVAITISRGQHSTMRLKWLTGTSVICLFLFIGWNLFTALSASSTPRTGMEGRLLPSLDLLLPDSVTHFNTANIPIGKPFIVIGFDPFCGHCQGETKDIIKNIQQLKDIPIYYVTPYPFWQMKSFYEHFKLEQYPNITMGMDFRNYFFSQFKSHTVPYTTIFDAQKRLKRVFIGQTDAKSLAKAVAE